MAAEVADYCEAVFMGMFFDGVAYVAYEAEGLGGLHADFEAFFGHIDEFLLLGGGLPHYVHAGGVGEVSVFDGGAVDIDNVAFFEFFKFAGDAVAYDFVDGDAAAFGIGLYAVFGVASVAECGGGGAVVEGILVDEVVELEGCDAFADVFAHEIKYAGVDYAASSDSFYFFGGADEVACGDFISPVLV